MLRALRRLIGRIEAVGAKTRHRRDQNDRAAGLHHFQRLLREQHMAAHVHGEDMVPRFLGLLVEPQPVGDADDQRQPVEPAHGLGAFAHHRPDRGAVGHVHDFGKRLAAFGCDLRHRGVGGFLAVVDTGDMRAFASAQQGNRAAVADRRIGVDHLPLASADDDDFPPLHPAAALRLSQRFGVDRCGRVKFLRGLGGRGHGSSEKDAALSARIVECHKRRDALMMLAS